MADLLERGLSWLRSKRHSHMTREVEYQRGTDRVTLNATVGRTAFEQETESGRVLRVESRDFLVRAEDLTLFGLPFTPERLDRIRTEIEGKVQVYEVRAPAGQPPFSFADPYRKTIRVHTVHVQTEDP